MLLVPLNPEPPEHRAAPSTGGPRVLAPGRLCEFHRCCSSPGRSSGAASFPPHGWHTDLPAGGSRRLGRGVQCGNPPSLCGPSPAAPRMPLPWAPAPGGPGRASTAKQSSPQLRSRAMAPPRQAGGVAGGELPRLYNPGGSGAGTPAAALLRGRRRRRGEGLLVGLGAVRRQLPTIGSFLRDVRSRDHQIRSRAGSRAPPRALRPASGKGTGSAGRRAPGPSCPPGLHGGRVPAAPGPSEKFGGGGRPLPSAQLLPRDIPSSAAPGDRGRVRPRRGTGESAAAAGGGAG